MPPADVRLTVEDLVVGFGGNTVLQGVSFSVARGFTGLIGPNGAGKTTLLNAISGYVSPTRGRVLLGDRPLTSLRPHRIARRGLGRTFQTPRLVPELTVWENVMLGLDGHIGWDRKRSHVVSLARVEELLRQLDLNDWRDRPAASLPFSSQKVVEVARALAADPLVVLLDEPAAGLGPAEVERLIEPLKRRVEERGLAVLIVEHDIELVTRLCSRIVVLDFGQLIADGAPAQVLRLPHVVNAYLGAGVAAVG